MEKLTVITLHDCFLINEGFRSVITSHDELEFLQAVADESQLEEALKNLQPSILVLDPIYTKRKDYMSVIRNYSADTRLIFISQNYSPAQLKEFLTMSISAFLLYTSAKKEIAEALLSVRKGKTFFAKGLMHVAIDAMRLPENSVLNLSDREREVVDLMVKGLSSKEIREKLSVSIHTINSHKKNIFRKLNINKASDVMLFALRNGLVEMHS